MCIRDSPGSEHGLIQHKALGQADAAALALGGIDGNTGFRERLYIAINGAGGDLQLLGQLAGGHDLVFQQQIYNAKQAMNLHSTPPFFIKKAHITVSFGFCASRRGCFRGFPIGRC